MAEPTPAPATSFVRYDPDLKFVVMFPMRTDGLCRCGCGNKAKRSWACKRCMDRSVEVFKIQKGDAGAIRAVVFRRDKGVCAGCKMNTEKEREKCWQHEHREHREKMYSLGFPSPSQSWWEADHIIEVVRGGGGCGIENFQTLCCRCHKAKTARLARERAAERRAGAGKACVGQVPHAIGDASPLIQTTTKTPDAQILLRHPRRNPRGLPLTF